MVVPPISDHPMGEAVLPPKNKLLEAPKSLYRKH